MNKAKFMLLGIGVVGVVGGALAFKAQKFGGDYVCTQVKGGTNCSVNWITTNQAEPNRVVSFCTNDQVCADAIATLTVVSHL